MKTNRIKPYWLLILGLIIIVFWIIPVNGAVIILSGDTQNGQWPRFDMKPQASGTEVEIVVSDIKPWSYVELIVNNTIALPKGDPVRSGLIWTWRWSYQVPNDENYDIVFYTNCHLGCPIWAVFFRQRYQR